MPEPEAKYVELGNRLREARLRAGLQLRPISEVSQERMAQLVGRLVGRNVSQGNWSYWEQGRREPDLEVIRAVAKLSGLTPDYIAFGPPDENNVAPETKPLTPVARPAAAKSAKRRRRAG